MDYEQIALGIDNIKNGFDWGDTAQGYEYWQEVVANLEVLLVEAEKWHKTSFEKIQEGFDMLTEEDKRELLNRLSEG